MIGGIFCFYFFIVLNNVVVGIVGIGIFVYIIYIFLRKYF